MLFSIISACSGYFQAIKLNTDSRLMKFFTYPKSLQCSLALIAILLIILLFLPGLQSSFFLDDYHVLSPLANIETEGYLHYIFGGLAGPTGRPLAMLSFALQHSSWSEGPFAFKLFNLILHLANGILLFFITRYLLDRLQLEEKAKYWVALLAVILWLCHPMQLSTVLYTVQRMVILSTFFVLLGILGYLYLRLRYENRHQFIDLLLAGLWLMSMMAFSILAKENGILLCLYIISIEAIFFINTPKQNLYRLWYWIFLIVPLVALLIYLGDSIGNRLLAFEGRPFTMGQRLLTEAVILFEYCYDLLLPRPSAFSIFHDGHLISVSLFQPWYTVLAVGGALTLFVSACLLRRKLPLFAFAIFWYLSGHALESTFLDLELYFEHRNYLPCFAIFLAVAGLIAAGIRRINTQRLAIVCATSYYLIVITITYTEVRLWHNPELQAIQWSKNNPQSTRAAYYLGHYYLAVDELEKAEAAFVQMAKQHPNTLLPLMKKIIIRGCFRRETISEDEWVATLQATASAKFNVNKQMYASIVFRALDELATDVLTGKCEGVELRWLAALFNAFLDSPNHVHLRPLLHKMISVVFLEMGYASTALEHINRSVGLRESPENLIIQTRLLSILNEHNKAQQALQRLYLYLRHNPREYIAYQTLYRKLALEIANEYHPDG